MTGVDLLIAGDEIVMVREELDAANARLFGAPERARVIDNWREQYDAYTEPLHLTVVKTVNGDYVMAVWCVDKALADEVTRHGLPVSLAVDMFGVGTIAETVTDDETARIMCREFARLVAHAELPWPPEDDMDVERWRLAGTLIAQYPAR